MLLQFFSLLILLVSRSYAKHIPKNVIIIMADDLGYNDVSFRGSTEIPTYNIDALAFSGIILNNFRTPPICTPSRSALMTGKYPHHLGMQHVVIVNDEPWGLPPFEKTLPQYFKEAGYVTAMIGKWHLGFHQDQYTPNYRGFDSFFGCYGGIIDYWDYTLVMSDRNYSRGYDMRKNYNTIRFQKRKYVTELFTDEAVKVIKNHDKKNPLFLMVSHLAPHAANEDDPMQAKQEDIDRFSYIADKKRRTLAAMIYQLDISVGKIVKSLKEKKLLKDSILIFYSDNGGPTDGIFPTASSNYPLRGQKFSGWEGAIRTNAIIYAPFLPQSVVREGMFYVGDLLPTLKTLAGANYKIKTKIDGIDQTDMLKYNWDVRDELVDVDDVIGYGSYIYNGLKLVNGSLFRGIYDGWLGSNNNTKIVDKKTYLKNLLKSDVSKALNSNFCAKDIEILRDAAKIYCTKKQHKQPCDLTKGPCLFNIDDDPCEENNLAGNEVLLRKMLKRYKASLSNLIPTRRQPSDPKSNPIFFDNTWSPWQENSI